MSFEKEHLARYLEYRRLRRAEQDAYAAYDNAGAPVTHDQLTRRIDGEKGLRETTAKRVAFERANAFAIDWASKRLQEMRTTVETRAEAGRIESLRAAGYTTLARWEELRKAGPEKGVEASLFAQLHGPQIRAEEEGLRDAPVRAAAAVAQTDAFIALVELTGGVDEAAAVLEDE